MKKTLVRRNINLPKLMRAMGYHPILDRRAAKESWVRTLGRGHYPRFHLYVGQRKTGVEFNLHLDQKKSAIALKGVKRHAGEYDGSVVEAEMARIERWMNYALAGGKI